MFRRRRRGSDDDETDDAVELDDADQDDEGDEGDEEGAQPARPRGPWDVEDAPADDVARLDLGSLRIPGLPGIEIQVNMDDASGAVVAVTAVQGKSALQLQAFAAARGEALWPQVRRELAAGITKDGGLADVDGIDDPAAGISAAVKAKMPFPQPDGSVALADVRFYGTDGPRWMLRGVLSGPAALAPASAEPLLEVYRGTVVVRGGDAFAPSEPLPLRLPEQAASAQAEAEGETGPDRTKLDPMSEGPRITEIR